MALCHVVSDRVFGHSPSQILYFDTAGLESHKYSLSNQYYRQTDAVLFCYSLIDESTIAVLPNWKDDADSQCARSVSILVISLGFALYWYGVGIAALSNRA